MLMKLSAALPAAWLLLKFMVLLDVCQNRPHCHLVASTETFRQDPCPGTGKYLEVAYKCHPENFQSQAVCEGEEVILWCQRSTRIAVQGATFGRTPVGLDKCPPNKPGYIDCRSSTALEEVRKRCHGRKQCSLEAQEQVFGNPCASGVNKYLNVTYACVPKRILKNTHRKGHRRKKKKKKGDKNENHSTTTVESSVTPSLPPLPPETTTLEHSPNTSTVTPEKASADAAGKGNSRLPQETDPSVEENKVKDGKESGVKDEGEEEDKDTEKVTVNLTVLCVNHTRTVSVGGTQTEPSDMGVVRDWFNALHFLQENEEKALLYLVLGVCVGLILLLVVVLAKVCWDFRRRSRAKLDVTEPTHSQSLPPNHHALEAARLERVDSLDRIEVVRFSPRGTLRGDPGNRSLSNYYG